MTVRLVSLRGLPWGRFEAVSLPHEHGLAEANV